MMELITFLFWLLLVRKTKINGEKKPLVVIIPSIIWLGLIIHFDWYIVGLIPAVVVTIMVISKIVFWNKPMEIKFYG